MSTRFRSRFIVVATVVGILCALVPASTLAQAAGGGLEIQTGAMLGNGYDPHAFYVRSNGGGAWQLTAAGSAVEGRLLNFRAANAIFNDEDGDDGFDAQANTDAFVSNLDDYRAHGILALTVSLQGGNPGYEGALASAFTPDGALKDDWMGRAAQVIEAAEANGQVIILTYFYQRQDEVLRDADAIRQAVRNATDWLIANDYRNVIIEIANEHNSGKYNHSIISDNTTSNGIGELITLAQSRFADAGWRAPVSASSADINFKDAIQATADLALVHGNLTSDWDGDDTEGRMRKLVEAHAVPIVMNEDRNGYEPGTQLLERDTQALDAALRAGGSWGLMWQKYNQYAPFGWSLGNPSQLATNDGYFHAILDVFQSRAGGTPPPPPPPPPPPDDDEYSVVYSVSTNRSAPTALNGATVSGGIYPFTTPDDGVKAVEFLLDGDFVRYESGAPFDFVGGSIATPRLWDTRKVTDGQHTISAFMRLTNGTTTTTSATFTVANDTEPPPPPPPPPPADTTPPTISDIDLTNLTTTGATIEWVTNEAATSQVSLTSSAGCGEVTNAIPILVTDHIVQLSGLSPGTRYTYRVMSADANDNLATSARSSFTTPNAGDELSVTGFIGICAGHVLNGKVYIEALVNGGNIAKVVFTLSGPKGAKLTERNAPYYFFGNGADGPYGWNSTMYPDGTYTLRAVATNRAGETATSEISFSVDNP